MTPRHILFVLLVAVAILAIQSPARAQGDSYRKVDGRDCPILDMPFDTAGGFDVGYVLPADTSAPGWEELSFEEVGAWARFGDWENESGGDFELQGLWDTAFLTTSGEAEGDDAYPLTMARVRLTWTQRFEANYGFEADASPGLYSSLDTFKGEDLSIPFGFRWIKPFTPDFSVYAGANVYPTFDHTVDPRVGLRWAHRDTAILDIGYPESSITFKPHRRFRISGGIRVADWPEYNLGGDTREKLRYEEIRIYGAVEFGLTDYILLSLNGGSTSNRKIAFESEAADVEVDDALFAGIGLNWLY